jgi:hypothetical protein
MGVRRHTKGRAERTALCVREVSIRALSALLNPHNRTERPTQPAQETGAPYSTRTTELSALLNPQRVER